jgi:hypothetical protein
MFVVHQEIKRTANKIFAMVFSWCTAKSKLAVHLFVAVRLKTHGKQSLYRAPEIKHTSKN